MASKKATRERSGLHVIGVSKFFLNVLEMAKLIVHYVGWSAKDGDEFVDESTGDTGVRTVPSY